MSDLTVLVEEVHKKWMMQPPQGFFVAQVKPFLAAYGIDISVLFKGQQVRQYLESEVPQLKLIQHEREPTNWALVPADAEIAKPYSQYFISAQSKSLPKKDFPFQNALKAAFTRKIEARQRRWIYTAPPRFLDLPTDEIPDNAVEVAPAVIEEEANEAQVTNLIENWLSQNGLNPDQYRFSKSSSMTKPKMHRSALHQLLALLPPDDLDRISIPLDVVRKLLDKSEDPQR